MKGKLLIRITAGTFFSVAIKFVVVVEMTTCSNAGGGHGSPVFGEVSCDGGVIVVVVTVVVAEAVG